MFISPKCGDRGLERLSCFKYYTVLKINFHLSQRFKSFLCQIYYIDFKSIFAQHYLILQDLRIAVSQDTQVTLSQMVYRTELQIPGEFNETSSEKTTVQWCYRQVNAGTL